ncbi:MAG: putative endonuclease [Saprospiraceae bacterium]|jgi:putative endonuclease
MIKKALNKILRPAGFDTTLTTREIGQNTEQLAKAYLVEKGLKVHTQNYRCQHGEIDLIMRDADCWTFIEVRYRNSVQFGGGIESVDSRKQKKLIRTAEHFMLTHTDEFDSCRFDVIAMSGPLKRVKIEWIQDAFVS